MSTTLCEKCFPNHMLHEKHTLMPTQPCDICGDLGCVENPTHLFPRDPRTSDPRTGPMLKHAWNRMDEAQVHYLKGSPGLPPGDLPKPSYKIAVGVSITCDNPKANYPEQVEAAMALAFSTLNGLPAEPGRVDSMQFEDGENGATTIELTLGTVQTVFRQVPDYQQRVLDEQLELQKKLDALQAFINQPDAAGTPSVYAALPLAERANLREQCTAMWNYNVVLLRRIKDFRVPKPDPVAEPAEVAP